MSELEATRRERPEDGIYGQYAYQYLPSPTEGSVLDLTDQRHVRFLLNTAMKLQLDGRDEASDYLRSKRVRLKWFGGIEWADFTQAVFQYLDDYPLIGSYVVYLVRENVPLNGHCMKKGLLGYFAWVERRDETAASEERVRREVPHDMTPSLQRQGEYQRGPRYVADVSRFRGDDAPTRKPMPS